MGKSSSVFAGSRLINCSISASENEPIELLELLYLSNSFTIQCRLSENVTGDDLSRCLKTCGRDLLLVQRRRCLWTRVVRRGFETQGCRWLLFSDRFFGDERSVPEENHFAWGRFNATACGWSCRCCWRSRFQHIIITSTAPWRAQS